jgi:hypothetical protein
MSNCGVLGEIYMQVLCEFLCRHRLPKKLFNPMPDIVEFYFGHNVFSGGKK